jgi:hypothetical protein
MTKKTNAPAEPAGAKETGGEGYSPLNNTIVPENAPSVNKPAMAERTAPGQIGTTGDNGSGPSPQEIEVALRTVGQIDPECEQIIRARLLRQFSREVESPDCPPLPAEARLDSGLADGAGTWVDLYVSHAAAISPMTPRRFHESAALWLASVAIARRLVLKMPFGDVYPNLFIAWIAPTTLYRKSTGLNVARSLAGRVFPHLLAAQDTTPEAFLSDMAGREPSNFDKLTEQDKENWRQGRNYAAQKGWVLDEMSSLLVASGRDYNAGLTEALLRFYDCRPDFRRSTRGQGLIVVHNTCLSMIGASTPTAMARHLTAEKLWTIGWWPRFAVLTPDAARPEWSTAQERDEPPELAAGLRRLYDQLPAAQWPDPPKATTVRLDAGVHDAWERYNKAASFDLLTAEGIDARLHGTYGRLPTQALKVAIILATLDWEPDRGNAPTVRLPHLARAVAVCEDWRASAHRVLSLSAANESDRLRERILHQISRAGSKGATMRELRRSITNKEPAEIQAVLTQMIAAEEIKAINTEPGEKGGRRTTRYRIVAE